LPKLLECLSGFAKTFFAFNRLHGVPFGVVDAYVFPQQLRTMDAVNLQSAAIPRGPSTPQSPAADKNGAFAQKLQAAHDEIPATENQKKSDSAEPLAKPQKKNADDANSTVVIALPTTILPIPASNLPTAPVIALQPLPSATPSPGPTAATGQTKEPDLPPPDNEPQAVPALQDAKPLTTTPPLVQLQSTQTLKAEPPEQITNVPVVTDPVKPNSATSSEPKITNKKHDSEKPASPNAAAAKRSFQSDMPTAPAPTQNAEQTTKALPLSAPAGPQSQPSTTDNVSPTSAPKIVPAIDDSKTKAAPDNVTRKVSPKSESVSRETAPTQVRSTTEVKPVLVKGIEELPAKTTELLAIKTSPQPPIAARTEAPSKIVEGPDKPTIGVSPAVEGNATPASPKQVPLPSGDLNISTPVIEVSSKKDSSAQIRANNHPGAVHENHAPSLPKPASPPAKDADVPTVLTPARHEAGTTPAPAPAQAAVELSAEPPPASAVPQSATTLASSHDAVPAKSAAPLPRNETTPAVIPDIQGARLVNRSGQEEMHIGLRTPAFGNVEVHTVVRQSEIGVSVGSEKGDLHNFLSAEVPSLQANLREQDLTFNNIRFFGSGAMTGDAGNPGGHSQPGHPQPQPQFSRQRFTAAESDTLDTETAVPVSRGLSLHA
jgi:hypothetical protein